MQLYSYINNLYYPPIYLSIHCFCPYIPIDTLCNSQLNDHTPTPPIGSSPYPPPPPKKKESP